MDQISNLRFYFSQLAIGDGRLKSARTIASQSSTRRNSNDTIETNKSSIRRNSKTSILTSKTLLLEDIKQSKTVYNFVNWQTVVRKYYETLGLVKPIEETDDID